jgi:Hint module
MAKSDPCACKNYNGRDCEPPGFTNTQKCNLCGGNKVIGDPDRIISRGILTGASCINVFDDNKYGAFASVCSQATSLVKAFCKCTTLGKAVKQCIQLEKAACNPRKSSDVCCAGKCKYLRSKGGYRCTERPGDTPPRNLAIQDADHPCESCLSGDMRVITLDKGDVPIANLEIGDQVMTKNGTYETIHSFRYHDETHSEPYIRIVTNYSSIELSRENRIFVERDHAVPVYSLQRGDSILLSDGTQTRIQKLQTVTRQGIYAPVTKSGNLRINNFWVMTSTVEAKMTSASSTKLQSSKFSFPQSGPRHQTTDKTKVTPESQARPFWNSNIWQDTVFPHLSLATINNVMRWKHLIFIVCGFVTLLGLVAYRRQYTVNNIDRN